jgi:hypothetical protein
MSKHTDPIIGLLLLTAVTGVKNLVDVTDTSEILFTTCGVGLLVALSNRHQRP